MNAVMPKDRVSLRHVLLFFSLLFVSFSQGEAQIFDVAAEPPGMDTIQLPPGYRFDNTFRFGAIVSGADSLTFVWMKGIGLDYTYTYGGPSIEEFAGMRDSSGWPGNEPDRWPVRRGAERWRHQAEIGVGAIYAPGYVEHSVPDAQALEMLTIRREVRTIHFGVFIRDRSSLKRSPGES